MKNFAKPFAFLAAFALVGVVWPVSSAWAQEAPPAVEEVGSKNSADEGGTQAGSAGAASTQAGGSSAEPGAEPSAGSSTPGATDSPRGQKDAGPFKMGSLRVGLNVGYASVSRGFSTESWLLLGGGLGYFVYDGIEAGFDTTFWVVGSPFITTITPGLRYVFHMVPVVKPYVGTFYKRYFVSNFTDTNAVGARAGVLFMTGKRSYFGGGIVYEHLFEGDNSAYFAEGDYFYPELTLAITF